MLNRCSSRWLRAPGGPFPRLLDPQEAHLGAEVESVSDVREEGLGVAGGAGRHAGPTGRRVVVDVFRQDAAFLKEDPGEGRQQKH